jgi:hypothetical protein
MSQRYKGGVISATPPTTSTSSASGVWTEQQFMQGVASGSWPALAGAPTIGTATAGALSASVAFTAPTYTGSGITGYTATSSPGGITGTGSSSPVTVSGLTAGTAYTFTVTATTAAGQGPASAASNSVTPFAPSYIEEAFSTYLYTGTSANLTITNNIDLSTKGGLVWIKERTAGLNLGHFLFDSARGLSNRISTNNVNSQTDNPTAVNAFNANGFSMGSSALTNYSSTTYASWTFAEQSKFFDAVTWTGNGSNRTIAHNLGSVPGCIIVKRTDDNGDWTVYHRSLGNTQYILVNSTSQKVTSSTRWNDTTPTSTVFSLGTDANVNASGGTYVAYLWAHDAGGFGLSGSDNVVSCGTVTTNGSGTATVNLGYEPQWILFKQSNGTSNWTLLDTMRGWNMTRYEDKSLYADTTAYEADGGFGNPTSTGFYIEDQNASADIIYIAIRRGPMKVPTVGTSVFNPIATTGDPSNVNVGFPTDLYIENRRDGASSKWTLSRLTGGPQYLSTNTTNAEATYAGTKFDLQNFFTGAALIGGSASIVSYMFKRAPSFFDQVCYTGTGASGQTKTHNLGVTPELMIIKNRGPAGYTQNWTVYPGPLGTDKYMFLNTTAAAGTFGSYWGDTPPTSTGFTVGNYQDTNASTLTYVAYLFATAAGVSKVGSYTGNGSTQTINCGFTTGARFVLLKRTDSTGDWYVYDTARGMTVLTDPYSFLNLGASEVATLGSVTTVATGFALNSAILADINVSAGTYIFLAIA